MQVDFVENVTTKINCLRKSVYWPYNPHLDSTVHQFQEVVIYFSNGPASQFKLGVLLSSITQLGRNSGNNLFATSHCNLGHADGIG